MTRALLEAARLVLVSHDERDGFIPEASMDALREAVRETVDEHDWRTHGWTHDPPIRCKDCNSVHRWSERETEAVSLCPRCDHPWWVLEQAKYAEEQRVAGAAS